MSAAHAALHLPVWSPRVGPAELSALGGALQGAGVALERERPVGVLTTLGVGGAAALFVAPATVEQLQLVLRMLADHPGVPLLVLGRGSNLLVGDGGWPGLALRLGSGFRELRRGSGDHDVRAGAAVAMPALAAWTAQEGLAGLEFAAGIPGSLGGAVRMNAGAHGGDMAAILTAVDLVVDGALVRARAEELRLAYRTSTLPPRGVVVAAECLLRPDDPAAIRRRLDALRAWRRAAQPLRERNCGSVFTNPPGGSAGRLVEQAGLKGHQVGGARISTKHANFIVVERSATAADVVALIAAAQQAVAAAGGPLLAPEVRLVGCFPDLPADPPA